MLQGQFAQDFFHIPGQIQNRTLSVKKSWWYCKANTWTARIMFAPRMHCWSQNKTERLHTIYFYKMRTVLRWSFFGKLLFHVWTSGALETWIVLLHSQHFLQLVGPLYQGSQHRHEPKESYLHHLLRLLWLKSLFLGILILSYLQCLLFTLEILYKPKLHQLYLKRQETSL